MTTTPGWLKNSSCVRLTGFSRDTFNRRRMPWDEQRVPGKIRYKLLVLDADADELPRFYLPDVHAFMTASPGMRSALEFIPVFTAPASAHKDSFHIPTDDDPVITPVCWRIEQSAQFLDVSRDSIEIRMIDWEEEPVPYRIRCGKTELKIGRNYVRVCYRPDVEALLKVPQTSEIPALMDSYHRGRSTGSE